jgi:integrase
MKPTIRFELKDTIVHVKIAVAGMPSQLFSLGISLDPGLWFQRKQICGDPTKQLFLNNIKKILTDLYLPGKTPEDLWQGYTEVISADMQHTVTMALQYIVKHKPMSKATKWTYQEMEKKAEKYNFGSKQISNLTPAAIRDFLEDIRTGDNLKEGSVYTYYNAVASALTFYMGSFGLEAQGKIEGIMKAPHLERGKIQYKDHAFLETEDLVELMKIDLTDDESLFEARKLFIRQCYTGMAKADVFKMNTLDGYVQDDTFDYKRKKTNGDCRIPITSILRKNLEEFTWPLPFGQRQYNNLLRKLGAMIGKPMSSHVGRHTFGVIFLEAGFSLETVSKMMGHHSVNITEQCYAKVTKKRVDSERTTALPKLDSIIEHF